MSIIGIGVDIIKIERIDRVIRLHPSRFLNKVFTKLEQDNAPKSKAISSYYAGRWAAKEAAYKSLQASLEQGISWKDFEIEKSTSGAPVLNLSGRAKKHAENLKIEKVHLSISHEKDYAIAYTIAVGS